MVKTLVMIWSRLGSGIMESLSLMQQACLHGNLLVASSTCTHPDTYQQPTHSQAPLDSSCDGTKGWNKTKAGYCLWEGTQPNRVCPEEEQDTYQTGQALRGLRLFLQASGCDLCTSG